jgi:hypothetical protein
MTKCFRLVTGYPLNPRQELRNEPKAAHPGVQLLLLRLKPRRLCIFLPSEDLPDRSEKAVPFGWRLARIAGGGWRGRLDRDAIRIGFNQALIANRLLRRQRCRLGGLIGRRDR